MCRVWKAVLNFPPIPFDTFACRVWSSELDASSPNLSYACPFLHISFSVAILDFFKARKRTSTKVWMEA